MRGRTPWTVSRRARWDRHTHTHSRIHKHTRARTYTHTHRQARAHRHTRADTHTDRRTHAHIHKHANTHSHTGRAHAAAADDCPVILPGAKLTTMETEHNISKYE